MRVVIKILVQAMAIAVAAYVVPGVLGRRVTVTVTKPVSSMGNGDVTE